MPDLEIGQYHQEGYRKRERIDFLIQQGLATETIGSPNDSDTFSFATWSRKLPEDYLLYYINVARFLNPKAKLIVAVDDLLSQAFFERTDDEQERYNEEYKTYIENNSEARVIFSSNFLDSDQGLPIDFFKMAANLSLSNFIQLLPYEKRRNIWNGLSCEELVHAINHLLVLDHLSKISQTLITGKTTKAIIVEHRNLKKDRPLSAIFVPFFYKQEDARRYINKISQHRQNS